ncbi:MAG: zinc-dependent metalloprotease [Planctomycetota bacterium]
MKPFRIALACALSCAALAAAPALADDQDHEDEKHAKEDEDYDLDADREHYGKWDEKLKGWKEQPGFLALYRKEKEEQLLAAVPRDLLQKPFFLATSISGGTSYAGWQWFDKLVRLERHNDKLLLVELNTRQRAEKGKPVASVVRRTYEDRLLATLEVLSIGPKGQVLVDLGALLANEYSTFFGGIFSLRSSLARFTAAKAFPKNDEVAVRMPLYGDGTFVTLHYSLSALPEEDDYQPRHADDRIGYFDTAIRDYTGGDPQEGRMIRLINRWRLEKADPALKMSPPKEPIVFYVEKTVPIEFRQAVHEGILEWNRAFEKVGIQGAIVVRQQTETQFADLDPEDVRYNFFRWITSEEAFAMGPSRVDPRTGRILDADIIFDDSMLRGYMRDYGVMIREEPKKRLTRRMAKLLDEHPDLHPLARLRSREDDPRLARVQELVREAVRPAEGKAPVATAEGLAKLRRDYQGVCQVGRYLPQQVGLLRLALGGLAQQAAPGEGFSVYLGQIVKETVMHEVGHTLGLRHNFKASTWLPLEKINSAEKPAATSASVMDYHPVNVTAPGKPQGNFLETTIGPYDFLAIEFGYALVAEDSKELAAIPRKMAEQGLPYATDEDLGSPDPGIAQWDLGQDPIAFADARVALVADLWKDLEPRVVQDDQSYSRLRRALDVTLFELQFSAISVSRQVGGLRFVRDHRGDPKARPPIEVVAAADQRKALSWLCEQILQGKALSVPPALVEKLAASRWLDWSTRNEPTLDYSLMDRLSAIQSWVLFFLTSDDVLARVWENEQRAQRTRSQEQAITLPELLDAVEGAVFAELTQDPKQAPSAAQPLVSSQRQLLQDAYIRRLIALSLGNSVSPPVANKLAWSRLEQLEARFGRVLAMANLDPYTRSHLEALRTRSSKVRQAEYVHLASGGDALCSLTGVGPARSGIPLLLVLFGLGVLAALRRGEGAVRAA